MQLKTLSILIPAYNEEATIEMILDRVKEVELIYNIQKEIVIVNDCSKDATASKVEAYMKANPEMDIQFYSQEVNQGKGAAIHKAIELATGDYFLVQDADLEYDPEEYNLLVKPIMMDEADVVYGSRFMGGNPQSILYFWHS
ncbi:MAG: glycosyltransferase family 2 protein, partial [Flavobacteriales bacterium]|nr:glycosyltransferase family 2 protein [Flavobacteriales bacterium]